MKAPDCCVLTHVDRAFIAKKVEICPTSTLPLPFLLCIDAVFLVKLINTSAGSRCLLLSCVERMALWADFYVDVLLCRTCRKCISTVAGNSCLMVCRMDSLFHDFHLTIQLSNAWIIAHSDFICKYLYKFLLLYCLHKFTVIPRTHKQIENILYRLVRFHAI